MFQVRETKELLNLCFETIQVTTEGDSTSLILSIEFFIFYAEKQVYPLFIFL
jgi:hypothetical protein